MMEEYCPDCGEQLIYDYVHYYYVCPRCGLVIVDNIVDYPERSRSDESLPRTSGVVSHLFPNMGVGTEYSHLDYETYRISNLLKEYSKLFTGYPPYVKEDCCRLLKILLKNKKSTRLTLSKRHMYMYVVLYIVLKKYGYIVSLKDFLVKHSLDKKTFWKTLKEVMFTLPRDEVVENNVDDSLVDYIRTCCLKLNLDSRTIQLSIKLYKFLSDQGVVQLVRSSQHIVAASIIHIVSTLRGLDIESTKFSETLNISYQSMRNVVKKILNYLDIEVLYDTS